MNIPAYSHRRRAAQLAGALALGLAAVSGPQGAAAQEFNRGYVQLALGDFHSCALRHNGQVWCWGSNTSGQLGTGDTENRLVPARVASPAPGFRRNNIIRIAAGGTNTCALNDAGRAFCWGQNAFGQVGDGTTEMRTRPVQVSVLRTGVQTIALGFRYGCAIAGTGRAFCWGAGGSGRRGDGTIDDTSLPTPVSTVPGFRRANIADISAGETHSCALNAAGRAYCWGSNRNGRLGTGDGADSLVPTPVNTATPGFNLRNIARIEAGSLHSCALTNAGRVYCWGQNSRGQVGNDGDPTLDVPTPQPVDASARGFGIRNIAHIAAGYAHNCALTDAGRPFCWGWNNAGQIGDDSTEDRAVPVPVEGLGGGLRDIATGYLHSCAIDRRGDVWCWGSNGSGRLGDGTTNASRTPVRVVGLP